MPNKLLDNSKIRNSNTFCIIPFIHIYGTAAGDIVPCCEAQETPLNEPGESAEACWNNTNYRELRRALSNNERPERCKVCWHNEDSGVVSNRQQWESDNAELFGDEVIVDDEFQVYMPPQWIELKVSNFCNLKCIMCSTHSSYKRVQDLDIITKYTTDGYETRLLHPDELFDSINAWPDFWETVKVLQFTGGEPIINEEHYTLLAGIPAHLKKDIKLRYATNLTHITFKQYDLISIWKEFKHVNIKVSMDGIGDVYNYIRHGGDWDDVHNNMIKLNDEDNIDLAIGITVQAHNIFQMPEFYTFWKDSDIRLTFITANILHTPSYLSPALWGGQYRDALLKKLKASEHTEMDKFITYIEHNPPDEQQYNKMRNYTSDLEERYTPDITLTTIINKYLTQEIIYD
jgi:sulfatase maturation enzyme AslB (radical SAM superfamily)